MFVFETVVFWVMFVMLVSWTVWMPSATPLLSVVTKGGEGFCRLWAWFAIGKMADVTVTVWGYAHGLSWMEVNPILNTLEGTSDWSIWLVPQLLVGYGGLIIAPGFIAISFWRPQEGTWRWWAAGALWAWGGWWLVMGTALPVMTWAWVLFVRDGYAILP